jgi:hypothetical protein
VNHLDPRSRQRDFLADANPHDEKETNGTGRERASTVIARYRLLAPDRR